MITYINAKNAAKYQILFEQATKDLQTAHASDADFVAENYEIGNLEEYFAHLPELLALSEFAIEYDEEGNPKDSSVYNVLHSVGRRYSMLPLANEDEEIFQINANTREITVPAAFKANGVGVKDDQLAEILYFTIDRFFDITDLDTTDIYVQWESPKGVVGLSKPWVIDIYTNPDKITFGWAISKDMTDGAGNLKFAVRFVQVNPERTDLIFSLATLQQAVAVKPTLDIDFLHTAEKVVDNLILYRVNNSNTWVTGRDTAEAPEFKIDLPLVADIVGGVLTLKVQAVAVDGGVISYQWFKTNIVEEADTMEPNAEVMNGEGEDAPILVEVVYEATKDEEPVAGKAYFIAIMEDEMLKGYKRIGSFEEAGESEILEAKAALNVGLMEVPCGSYQVTATNKKSDKNVNKAVSAICVVPQPTVPVIDEDLPERAVFDAPESPVKELEFKVSNDADKKVLVGEEEVDSIAGELSFVWFKDGVELKGEVGAVLDLSKIEKVEGVYTVKAINTKNKAIKEIAGEVSCRVSLMPVMPADIEKAVVSINGEIKEGVTFDGIKNEDAIVLTVDASKAPVLEVAEDSFKYQWMLSTDADFDFEDVEPKDDILLEGEEGAELSFKGADMPDAARYYCVFSYVKNGVLIEGHSTPIKLIK